MNDHLIHEPDDTDEMLPEYDFSHGVRGKHAQAYQQGYSTAIYKSDGTIEERTYTLPEGVVVLDADVRTFFGGAKPPPNHPLSKYNRYTKQEY